ncbi:MAG: hypothetical protein WAJ93_11960, partial [Candidatus Nitrosopolaris sp.]
VEKGEYVMQLYRDNKSTREIAKLTHMSFRDIGAIIKKLKLEVDGERGPLEEDDDIKSKSKTTQALKLFSELQSPVEVAIALDLSVDKVRTIYREYWELDGMFKLAQIYDEAKYDVHDLLRLHKIVKNLGIQKQDIINVLELVKNNELETLQSKVENLKDEIKMWEIEKTKARHSVVRLNRMINELQSSLGKKEIMHF